MQVTAALVKELRERSGAGMMECKKALVETSGDIESALEHLRKTGAAKAAKKAGRVASEGAIVVKHQGSLAAILEVNSETDFVANDENFETFADGVVAAILENQPDSIEAVGALSMGGSTIEEARTQLVTKIGENISIRRFELIENSGGNFASYLHGKRIGVLAEIQGGDESLARDIAMHIAASNPTCVSEKDVPAELLEKEREVQIAQAEQSGKPPEIIEKMVGGRIKKFVNEITLEGQPFVKDPDKSVGKLLKEHNASVVRFIRFEVGEGIEKKVENFAEEVMAQAKGAE
ncbi:MAG: translation elongation factor Ts [Gammaproteobacteria bacterium]